MSVWWFDHEYLRELAKHSCQKRQWQWQPWMPRLNQVYYSSVGLPIDWEVYFLTHNFRGTRMQISWNTTLKYRQKWPNSVQNNLSRLADWVQSSSHDQKVGSSSPTENETIIDCVNHSQNMNFDYPRPTGI